MPTLMRYLFGLLFCLIVLPSQAQQALKFEASTWDFGLINEADGKVSHDFYFLNNRTTAIAIEQVVTTCGCTVPSYSKAPIQPGKRGCITVTFDPTGRTEHFDKSIRVVYDGGKNFQTLRIKGRVRLQTDMTEEYPYVLCGSLRAKARTLFCGTISQHSAKDFLVDLYNAGDSTLHLSGTLVSKDKQTSARFLRTVPPRTAFSAKITASPSDNYYGSFSGRLYLSADGKRSTSPILITGTAIEDFRTISGNDTPVLKLSQSYFRGKRTAQSVTITNAGKSDLFIRKIECPSGVRCNQDKELKIPSGAQKSITFTFDASALKGQAESRINLISNDRQSPVSHILFEWDE